MKDEKIYEKYKTQSEDEVIQRWKIQFGKYKDKKNNQRGIFPITLLNNCTNKLSMVDSHTKSH